jgi:hypothetical protein
MSFTFWKSVFISPIVLAATCLLATTAIAAPNASPTADDTEVEVASVTVKPSDWQYTSLEGLAAKYGCQTNFNNQPVSQVDFARGLNSCLARVEPLLAQQPTTVTKEDLESVKRLTDEFRAQLGEIDNRIAKADKTIAQAQANQFSTTTKLKGEAIFNLTSPISGATGSNTVFGNRVRLLLESSFTGQDKLYTRLAMGNLASSGGGLNAGATPEGTQVAETGGNNSTSVDWLAYQFPVGKGSLYIPAWNGIHVDYAPSYAPNFEDFTGGNGALSSFAESSPIYKVGGGAGVGATLALADTGLTSVNLGYFGGTTANQTNRGLFNGDNSFFTQANFKLSDKFEAGLTYVNSYHTTGNQIFAFAAPGAITGSSAANANPAGTKANSYGAALSYKASDTLTFNGFAMKTTANKATIGDQDILSYGAGVALPNVDGRGSLFGLFVGAEPYVTGGGASTPLHIEGFYKYKFSDNLSITPGVIYLTAPNQTNNSSAVIGTIRTTFTF